LGAIVARLSRRELDVVRVGWPPPLFDAGASSRDIGTGNSPAMILLAPSKGLDASPVGERGSRTVA
jgi:hypothetical protein